ncbi:MAG: hypothetical protein LKM39_02665 [Chiayiivirga sp.]|jgi:hypothetical protein|nr:hypothetical protein [Chiayiivirga sp.]
MAAFLQDQSPLTFALALAATVLVVATLARTSRLAPPPSTLAMRGEIASQLQAAAWLLLLSLPLAVVGFFLFPAPGHSALGPARQCRRSPHWPRQRNVARRHGEAVLGRKSGLARAVLRRSAGTVGALLARPGAGRFRWAQVDAVASFLRVPR